MVQKLKAAGKLRDERVGFVQIEGLLGDALKFGGLLSRSEVVSALEDAESWIRAIAKKVSEKNPQFKLPLD